jgi:hypothetical protein
VVGDVRTQNTCRPTCIVISLLCISLFILHSFLISLFSHICMVYYIKYITVSIFQACSHGPQETWIL